MSQSILLDGIEAHVHRLSPARSPSHGSSTSASASPTSLTSSSIESLVQTRVRQTPTPASTAPPRSSTPNIALLNVNEAATAEGRQIISQLNDAILAQFRLARSMYHPTSSNPTSTNENSTPHPLRYSIPTLLNQNPSTANDNTSRRRTHSAAFGPEPSSYGVLAPPFIKRQLCSVYAVEVQVGDVLKYGNRVNDGCKVTRVGLEDENEGQGYVEGGPVKLNGTVRIEWEDEKSGDGGDAGGEGEGRRWQLFGGLEMLEVMRVVKKSGCKEEFERDDCDEGCDGGKEKM